MSEQAFENRRETAIREAEARCQEVYSAIPEIAAIDKELSETGLKLFRAGMLPEVEREAEFSRLGGLTAFLQEKRKALLIENGYPEDYTKPHFHCEKCSDTGYIRHIMCDCLKKHIAEKNVRASGLGRYLDKQTFETFSLDYYPAKARISMSDTLEQCRAYADSFNGKTGESLLFLGSTGLGKTHLSSAIAQKVIAKGFSVVYDSAQTILSTFERDRFSQSANKPSDKYFDCDLLIIDDLGTEIKGASATAYFYTLINTRLVASKSVIITTNLKPEDIRRQYEERIVSRLFCEYTVYFFEGNDIRKIKIEEQND